MTEPKITLQAAHDDGPGNLPPTRVVIHATDPASVGYPRASAAGLAASTARYFTDPRSGGSAHYVVDVAGEQHCLPDAHIAWHAPPNPHSIGIEICGKADYTRAQWLSAQVWPAVERAAARAGELCARFGIPPVRLSPDDLRAGRHGICGHADVSAAWRQSTHTDPGPGFPWPEFMAAVARPTAPTRKALIEMIERTLARGSNYHRIICPVGRASAIVGAAYVSVSAAAGCTGRICFQVNADSDGAPPGAGPRWDFTARNANRLWHPIPDGTEFLECWIEAGGDGAVLIEPVAK